MLLNDVFDSHSVMVNLAATTKDDVFRELVAAIVAVHPDLDGRRMLDAVWVREGKMNTAIAPGIAVAHGYYQGLDDVVGAVGILQNGVNYGAADEEPVRLVFLLVMGDSHRDVHLRVLDRIATMISSGATARMLGARSPQEVYTVLFAE